GPGLHRITAAIVDTQGRPHQVSLTRWATGQGEVVWSNADGHGLQLTPEKKEYNVGDTARFLVQNPYPGAKALVTVERYGVLKQWVTTLEESTAVVEVEVEPDFMPGFYLSVSIASPRVEQPLGEGQVDLGKPAFRIGYLAMPVHDPVKRIDVKVDCDGETFKPRDTVQVSLSANLNHGDAELPPVEYAVAVLDEAVLDLVQGGINNWDVYRGFYKLESLDVANYHLLMRLIGRQKFEKKGANAGGGGGGGGGGDGPDLSMRSLFKFVSYWNPSLKADADGKAEFNFEAPDNLTGWRVLVMAVTPGDRMGLGEGRFKVNRPTELRPALPNQVIEGDRFRAGFTVMNRTDQERNLKVSLQATGALSEPIELETEVIAPPFKRVPLWLPLATHGKGEVTFTAKVWDEIDGDALQQSLPVLPWSVLETAATYGTTVADAVSENIAVPLGIRSDAGSVGANVSTSVVGNLSGAFKYMRDYPYFCWEQKLSKGVMASHYLRLKELLPADLTWPGAETLTAQTLAVAAEHQAPDGGMVYYVPQNRYVSPYLSAYSAIAFNWLRAADYEIPLDVEQRLHGYLETMLRKDVFPDFYSKGMASTVRAVALAALAPHGRINLDDLERYRSHLPQMSLFGKAHYLLAALQVEGSQALRSEVAGMILAQSNETGGKFIFQETLDSGYAQLLSSSLRDNGAVLSALLAYSETAEGAGVAQIPFKLVRTLTQSRGQRDRWQNTQENLFCLNALIEYRRIYETETPKMLVTARLDDQPLGETRFESFTEPPVSLQRDIGEGDPGKKMTLELQREGSGRLYYAVRLATATASPRQDSVNSGIEVQREVSVKRNEQWQLLQNPMKIQRGELVRVDLFVSLPAARNFVVVDDPVPGGLEPVNRDLATASTVDADEAKGQYSGSSFWHSRNQWRAYGYSYWSFYHKELRHHSARFYSEYLPAGDYHLSYVAQAIAAGAFSVMPTKAEEMYDPDVYGLSQPAQLQVVEQLE
ncbi:MAG: hypothetical protein OET90_09315, partial [Desulfuromonadales bacterium]|nr:hypothetical protein [Desulfuromonadales bacterium]